MKLFIFSPKVTCIYRSDFFGKEGETCVLDFSETPGWEQSNTRQENAELLRQHKTEELRATMFQWQQDGVDGKPEMFTRGSIRSVEKLRNDSEITC